MTAPFKQVFKFKTPLMNRYKEFTSVVMDQADFDVLCNLIKTTGMLCDKQLESIRQAKHVPMMAKGRKTQAIFGHLGVATDVCSVIVRGAGVDLAKQLNLTPEKAVALANDIESIDPA